MTVTHKPHLEELTTDDFEDRIFRTEDGWYWQTRGTVRTFGPFPSALDAAADNGRPLSDFSR